MSSGRILVADDEPSVRESVGYALEQEGFAVTLATDGDDAGDKLGNGEIPFDLLILDIMMPGKSGLDICREVRAHSPVPIILLTAKDAEVDKVVGLEVGADDYVTKPFGVLELLARVEALLRRSPKHRAETNGAAHERFGDVDVDISARAVHREGQAVSLTPMEFDLLLALLRRRGAVASRHELMKEVWGYHASVVSRTVDTHVAELRRKLEDDPAMPRHILTVRKAGYRLQT